MKWAKVIWVIWASLEDGPVQHAGQKIFLDNTVMVQSVFTMWAGLYYRGEDPDHSRLARSTFWVRLDILLLCGLVGEQAFANCCCCCFTNQLRMRTKHLLTIISYFSWMFVKLWSSDWIHFFGRCSFTSWRSWSSLIASQGEWKTGR